MHQWSRLLLTTVSIFLLTACSLGDVENGEAGEGQTGEPTAAAAISTASSGELQNSQQSSELMTAEATPHSPSAPSSTATAAPSATALPTTTNTPTPTATPVLIPSDITVEMLSTWEDGPAEVLTMQHPLFGSVYILDELNLDTPFKISWSDDNPRTAVVRFRNDDDVIVELNASSDPDWRTMPIEQSENESEQGVPRHHLSLNSGEIFSAVTAVERLATVEIDDEDGHTQSVQILFSRHDYAAGYAGPVSLAQPQYDQLELGIDWRSEQYAPQGAFAKWLNEKPDLWNRVTIEIEGRPPVSWRDIRDDDQLLHQELTSAVYEDQIAYYYLTIGGERQRFSVDRVPYYTKFEIVHSPHDEEEFYTVRAGRDPGVSEEMLQEMGEVVRHMFSKRPGYLHELALNEAVHSVAAGQDMSILPEIAFLADEIDSVIIDDENYGIATGVALLARHPEISASAGYFFENETPVLGYTLMHEIVHQVQYMVYGQAWSDSIIRYYENYMTLPAHERIPDIDYYETSPWEWDALLTPAWFSEGSDLYEHIEPYLDLELSSTGATMREHLQRRWGDPLEAYPGG